MSQPLFLATRKGLFRVEKSKNHWQITNTAFLGDHVTIVTPVPGSGTLFAGIGHGHFGAKMHRSSDHGDTWEEIAAPEYPPKPEWLQDKDAWGKPLEWKLNMIWAIEPGHPSQPGTVWCGTLPGGLFRSADSGASWSIVEPLWNNPMRSEWFGGGADLPGIHSICVHPHNAQSIGVGVSCGGYWLSEDGGQTWNVRSTGMWAAYMPPERKDDPNIQDPHRIVHCKSRPQYLWAQHHNGIFRSNDGAVSWTEVKNDNAPTFGFAVAVHPDDQNTAWFIPAVKDEKRFPLDGKVIVTRTRDGGQSFETLTRGLPQQYAYDLVFRHALDLDTTGNVLAFGSTTGNCWISEDQGDSFQLLSNHLPPVYCVRWG
jgi:hypothetical protein